MEINKNTELTIIEQEINRRREERVREAVRGCTDEELKNWRDKLLKNINGIKEEVMLK